MTDKERYATIGTWVDVEGAEISDNAIRIRMKEAEVVGETARLKTGCVLRHGFYLESKVRGLCRDLLNRLNTEYFSDPSTILYDLTAFAAQLPQTPDNPKSPVDLSTGNIVSLSALCHNGETLRDETYLTNAAVALGLAENSRKACLKQAETFRILKEIAGFRRLDIPLTNINKYIILQILIKIL